MAVRPLALLGQGEEAVVLEIRAGRGLQGRLGAMGLLPGRKVRMLSTGVNGPALVAIGDTRIALGRGQLRRVMVE